MVKKVWEATEELRLSSRVSQARLDEFLPGWEWGPLELERERRG
jgi:hypothetical protein